MGVRSTRTMRPSAASFRESAMHVQVAAVERALISPAHQVGMRGALGRPLRDER
ncbi:hypothetical protein GA0070620_0140 [Micromonospora krabiensis]|uniref:Uncharacterized protein n=1 Tax=Micromonospora krabiensis TaxID=307121 RepID=A0A1C3MWK3_9ACTN|nr:hypothetical protein GA0070620_0140 [Micromonospora krabiensis]